MTRLLFALVLVGFSGPVGSFQALAASPVAEVLCEPTQVMRDRLTRRLGVTRAATGIRDREQIMEVWTDRQGDWTMVVTYASGTSCIVAMGEHWIEESPHRDPA